MVFDYTEEQREEHRKEKAKRITKILEVQIAIHGDIGSKYANKALVEAEVDLPIWLKRADDHLGVTPAEFAQVLELKFGNCVNLHAAMVRPMEEATEEEANFLREMASFTHELAKLSRALSEYLTEHAGELTRRILAE